MNDTAIAASREDTLRFRLASSADAEAIACLINSAFRVEQPFIEGDRTSPDGVRTYMEKGQFLLAEHVAGLAGCVYVELRANRGYLVLLFVDPAHQDTGRGRKLVDTAEALLRD